MSTPEIKAGPDFDVIGFWYGKLGVANGDMVMIVPVGAVGGQGFQGELVDIVFVNSLPFAVIIKNMASGPVVIRWDSVCMMTKVQSPEVDAETLERIKAEFEASTGLTEDDVAMLANEAAEFGSEGRSDTD